MLLQEGATVTWDTPPPLSPWLECGFIALWIALIYGHWRLLRWFVAGHMNQPNWRRTRLLLPVVLMTSGSALPWLVHTISGDHTAFALVLCLCITVNLPAVPGIILAGAATGGGDGIWLFVILAWISWHLTLLWVEHRVHCTRPVHLDLGEPGTPQTDAASKQA
jgi:hypothetical protein